MDKTSQHWQAEYSQSRKSGDAIESQALKAQNHKPNHYQILNVETHANRLEIREAYLRLKTTYEHGSAALYSLVPDDEAKYLMDEMEVAYHVLSDDVSRRSYDLSLGIEKAPFGGVKAPVRSDERPPVSVQTERLVYAQETLRAERLASFGTRDPDRPERNPLGGLGRDFSNGTIQTNRSTLPVVKLKAEKCDGAHLSQDMAELISTSDLADGELYKKLREMTGVSQDEMQDRTKISVGYLLAIESNRLDRLPQAVYVKGFLRSYFKYIGAPEAEAMVNAFASRLTQWQAKHRS